MTANTFKPAKRDHKPAVLGRPVIDPAAWSADDFKDGEAFIYHLSGKEIDEILAATRRVKDSGIALKDVTSHEFEMPTFSRVLTEIVRDEVLHGRGFIFLRGMPVVENEVGPNAIAQWGMSTYVGMAQPQNMKGNLLEHVKNAGGDINSPTGRGYNSANALGFHSDTSDILSLMCLRGSKSGGEHRLVSSVTVYNEMLKRRPDYAKELEFHFYRTRRGEFPADEPKFHRQPVFSVTDGYFSARGASSTIKRAQKMEGVPKLTTMQQEAIDYYQSLAGELSLYIDWRPGDIYYVFNHVHLHARTAYEDYPEANRRRHLLRLWLASPGCRPLHPSIAEDMTGIKLTAGTELKTPMDMTLVS